MTICLPSKAPMQLKQFHLSLKSSDTQAHSTSVVGTCIYVRMYACSMYVSMYVCKYVRM